MNSGVGWIVVNDYTEEKGRDNDTIPCIQGNSVNRIKLTIHTSEM